MSKLKYAIISGEVSTETRKKIIKVFNSPENAHGDLIKVLLVSKTGAEGLDLKNVRETHQIEPYWDKARDDQFKGRAVRMGSHDALPYKDRDVQPYLYIAKANSEIWELMLPKDRELKSIDEKFHERALEKYKLNSEFRKLLSEVSIECELFGYENCRICAPTNQLLFKSDAATDIRLPDPCEVITETEIKAKEIIYNQKKYYYIENEGKKGEHPNYTFYEFRQDLDGFSMLDLFDPVITQLSLLLNNDN